MSDKDYDVGYGKPPKHTRFKKGRSGNLKGRPKKQRKSIDLDKLLDQKVRTRINGTEAEVDVVEATFQGVIARALKGSNSDIKLLLQLIERREQVIREEEPLYPTSIQIQFVESDGEGRIKQPEGGIDSSSKA